MRQCAVRRLLDPHTRVRVLPADLQVLTAAMAATLVVTRGDELHPQRIRRPCSTK